MPERDIGRTRAAIRAQADAAGEAGWTGIPVDVAVSPGGLLRVPRGAFEMWALSSAGGGHLAHPWEGVHPADLVMQGHNPFHADWLVGAGLDIDSMRPGRGYEHAALLRDAAMAAMSRLQKERLNFRHAVLMPGPWKSCSVFVPSGPTDLPEREDGVPPVVLIPNAGPAWLEVAHEALDLGGAVVTEVGGEMAHLVTALRGDIDGPIFRVPGARALFPPGARLELDSATGTITMREVPLGPFVGVADPFDMGR